MSVVSDSVAVLNDGLKAAAGEIVAYRRGNESIDKLVVVPAKTRHDDYGSDEATLTARDRDWIVWAADLAIGGQVWTPQRLDEIDWIDAAGVKHTYQVLPRAGDRCFRHTDQSQQQLRVYTVEKRANAE